MPSIYNFFHKHRDIHIPIIILDSLGIIFSFGVVFLGGIWCVYYMFHALKVKRKIKALKRCTEHIERERYINALIEYKKSIFLVIISFLESWLHVFYWGIISERFIHFHSGKDEAFLLKNPSFEFLLTVSFSLFILMDSLVCILTSYLTKAYGTERETKLNEKQLFAWMFLQLFIGWIVCLIPRSHVIGLPVYTLCIFIGQIVVYTRLSKRLYSVLRMRREDSYFEDREMHTRLVRMCKNFKYGAIAYTVVLVFFLSEVITEIVKALFISIVIKDRFMDGYLDPSDFLNGHSEAMMKLRISLKMISKIIPMLMIFFSLMVHLSIVLKAIIRGIQRTRNTNKQIKCVKDMLRVPLIGEN